MLFYSGSSRQVSTRYHDGYALVAQMAVLTTSGALHDPVRGTELPALNDGRRRQHRKFGQTTQQKHPSQRTNQRKNHIMNNRGRYSLHLHHTQPPNARVQTREKMTNSRATGLDAAYTSIHPSIKYTPPPLARAHWPLPSELKQLDLARRLRTAIRLHRVHRGSENTRVIRGAGTSLR
jgi:hypothetical protein